MTNAERASQWRCRCQFKKFGIEEESEDEDPAANGTKDDGDEEEAGLLSCTCFLPDFLLRSGFVVESCIPCTPMYLPGLQRDLRAKT